MRALTYHGPGQLRRADVDDAVILDPTDAVVRVETTTICGTDCIFVTATSPMWSWGNTGNVSVAAAGFWATASTAHRPSTFGCRTQTIPRIRCPLA